MPDKELKATLVWGQKGGESLIQSAKDVEKGLTGAGESLTKAGLRLGAVGASIVGPMAAAINSYVKNAGMADKTSRDWLATSQRIEQSQMVIGRNITERTLPLLQKAADLSERASRFVESHPGAIDAALLIGGSVSAASTLAIGAGQGARLVGSTAAGLGQIAALGGGAGGAGLAGLGGLGLGYAGAKALGYQGGPGQAAGDIGRFGLQTGAMPLLLGAAAARDLGLISDDTARKVGELAGAIGTLGQQAVTATTATAPANQGDWRNMPQSGAMLSAYTGYRMQQGFAGADYERQRTRTVQDQGLARYEAEQDTEISRTRTVRDQGLSRVEAAQDFQRSVVESEFEFYRSRSIQIRDFNISMSRSNEDYQRTVSRQTEDHQWNLIQAARHGDAEGIYLEMRSFNLQQTRQQEDRDISVKRQKDDQGRSLKDQAGAFDHSQKLADTNYGIMEERQRLHNDITLADMDRQHELQMDRMSYHDSVMLARFDTDYGIAQERMTLSLEWQLGQLGLYRDFFGKVEEGMAGDFSKFTLAVRGSVDGLLTSYGITPTAVGGFAQGQTAANFYQGGGSIVPGPSISGRAAGGYASGLIRTGERGYEYVLDHDTTRALEQRGGGRLTQSGLLEMTGTTRHIVEFKGDVPAGVSAQRIEAVVNAALADRFKRVTGRVQR